MSERAERTETVVTVETIVSARRLKAIQTTPGTNTSRRSPTVSQAVSQQPHLPQQPVFVPFLPLHPFVPCPFRPFCGLLARHSPRPPPGDWNPQICG